jgi:branched-chain amino acid transport system substrate-binding protein
MTLIRYFEGEGSGVPTAVRDAKRLGAAEPTARYENGFVVVTIFPLVPSLRARLTDVIPLSRLRIAAAAIAVVSVLAAASLVLLSGGESLVVYSSLPLQGPQRDRSSDQVRGMKLALKQAGGKAGEHVIEFRSLDDSTAESRGWAESSVADNAQRAAEDERTAAYLGEFNSGASEVSIPILSRTKIAQISPGNTAVGLTTDETGAEPDAPDKYYNNGFRNYARIVPRDTVQGDAMATLMKADGCERAAIASDKDAYGSGLSSNIIESLARLKVRIALDEPIGSGESAIQTLAAQVARRGVDCFVFSGDTKNGAVDVVEAVSEALPDARLYGPDGVADRGFTDPDLGGVSADIGNRVQLTLPALGPSGFGRAGKKFLADYANEYADRNPDPYAIYGYEAMRLALDAIARADSSERADIVTALFATEDRDSVLGRYSIDANGDTTLTDYGRYEIQDGRAIFRDKIKPKR